MPPDEPALSARCLLSSDHNSVRSSQPVLRLWPSFSPSFMSFAVMCSYLTAAPTCCLLSCFPACLSLSLSARLPACVSPLFSFSHSFCDDASYTVNSAQVRCSTSLTRQFSVVKSITQTVIVAHLLFPRRTLRSPHILHTTCHPDSPPPLTSSRAASQSPGDHWWLPPQASLLATLTSVRLLSCCSLLSSCHASLFPERLPSIAALPFLATSGRKIA